MLSMEENAFAIILKGGNGKSFAMEAIREAKNGNIDKAHALMNKASAELVAAHHLQSDMIRNEVNGTPQPISLLLIHAQDHLMNALTVKDMAGEMIDMYDKMNQGGLLRG
ncbi:PTS lactose/cellobiose transporter subunit IIA [Rossellomorea marisflavi]|uniref:PTS lactose/cellobiose transporter subunit IIA n=1 Tax=Rossellomorea marisflavi TaxID=189381 RepID=UPI002B4148F4|nr:PTS lactose/cellobiose transporter subunit IIA [Rossellomorea marisflavi]